MIDMGVEPYLLSSAMIGVLAQRLVRTICPSCKTNYMADAELLKRYGWTDKSVTLSKGRGCNECYDSGYKGRIAIHEFIEADEHLQKLIMQNASRDQLKKYIEQTEIATLFSDGLQRVRAGLTTVEEISRVTTI